MLIIVVLILKLYIIYSTVYVHVVVTYIWENCKIYFDPLKIKSHVFNLRIRKLQDVFRPPKNQKPCIQLTYGKIARYI